VRRTMHILDVICSVSRSTKCTKIFDGWGFTADRTGEFTALPRLPSWVSGGLLLRGGVQKEAKTVQQAK